MGELQPDAAEIERHIAVLEQGRPAYPRKGESLLLSECVAVALSRNHDALHACGASQASSLPRRARARLRLPGAVAHEQSAATSSVILFTRRVRGCLHPRKLAAVRVRRDVHHVRALRSCFDPRKRPRSRPRTRSGASPYSCSTCRARARRVRGLTGKPSACCWLGLV